MALKPIKNRDHDGRARAKNPLPRHMSQTIFTMTISIRSWIETRIGYGINPECQCSIAGSQVTPNPATRAWPKTRKKKSKVRKARTGARMSHSGLLGDARRLSSFFDTERDLARVFRHG